MVVVMELKNFQSIKLIPGGHSMGVINKGINKILGMGTITFIEPNFYKYGAVGHIMPKFNKSHLKTSCMIPSAVKEVQRSEKGEPGKKIGDFLDHNELGTIDKNTKQGIFGKMQKPIPNPYFNEPIPVASFKEIEVGSAKMYTVVDGDKVEEFNVTISTKTATRKNWLDLEIKVNDPDLIQRTGGFVKGMSGSPIVQNGRLVGALSHISARDSLCGFGVLVETMLPNLNVRESHFSLKVITKLFNYQRFDVNTVNSL